MIEYTMELDVEVGQDELTLFESLAGVKEVFAYTNTLTIRYTKPLAQQELRELTAVIHTLHKGGVRLISVGEELQTTSELREAISTHMLVL